MDRGPQRGRGAVPRVQPDQEAQAPLQHPAEGRQVLPLPGGDRLRGVAPGHGAAGGEAQGRPLLRAVRPRLRHPGDARPAAADVPDPHLLRQQARPAPQARPALPLRPHREVLGALRRCHQPGRLPDARRRAAPLPRRAHRPDPRAARQGDARGRLGPRVRAGGPPAGPDHLGPQGHRTPADGRRPERGLRRHRPGRGRPRGVDPGLQRPPGPHGRPQGTGAGEGRGAHAGRPVGPHPRDALRRRPGGGRPEGGAAAGRARGARPLRGVPLPRAGLQGADPGSAAGQQAQRSSRP